MGAVAIAFAPGEALCEGRDAEEVVAVAVRDVDRGQLLTLAENLFYPVTQVFGLGCGDGCIDEDSFFVAVDERAGDWRP